MAARLPHSDQAVLDVRKIEDYWLNPAHSRGPHKARVFPEVLDVEQGVLIPPSGDTERVLW